MIKDEEEMMKIVNNSKTDAQAYSDLLSYLYSVNYSLLAEIAFDFVRSNFKEPAPPTRRTELVEDRLTGTLYEMPVEED